MNYGIRAAAQAMNLGTYKQDIISNNIANANTIGFKSNSPFAIALSKQTGDKSTESMPFVKTDTFGYSTYTDQSDGTLKDTGRDLDLAISGSGYFLVRGEDGVELSRKGNFRKGLDGHIIDSDGKYLLASKGVIEIEDDVKNIVINQSGEIFMNGEYYDTVLVTDINNPSSNLIKKDNGYYELAKELEYTWTNPNGNKIFQGYLEESNVDSLKEMVKMIENEKSFNINQKMIQSIDSTLDTVVNQIGKV